MKLEQLCRAAGINCPDKLGRINVTGVVSDSRRVEDGMLFVCLRGTRCDGHEFIAQAISRGAAAIVTEQGSGSFVTVPNIKVINTRQAFACLVDAWYGCPSKKMKYVAVTGTNGKTSVTHYLKAIFEAAGYRCGLVGTVGCFSAERRIASVGADPLANMTTPDPEQLYPMLAQMADDKVEYVFLEATSHALALGKLSPIHCAAAIFTNLTSDHLDFHVNMKNYLDAKKILFSGSEISVINTDSGYAAEISEAADGKVVSCSGEGRMASYRAVNIMDHGIDGVSYTLISAGAVMRIRCALGGKFNIINTLEAAACALELGLKPLIVTKAISHISGIPGRLERIRLGRHDFSVFIDYAHTPDALENVLRAAREFARDEQRIVLLFGCGGNRDKSKRPLMGKIATELADRVYITSDNSRGEKPEDIISEIVDGAVPNSDYCVITDRREAIMNCIQNALAGDVIILAGKGHETYEIDRDGRRPFCEKDIIYEALRLRQDK